MKDLAAAKKKTAVGQAPPQPSQQLQADLTGMTTRW